MAVSIIYKDKSTNNDVINLTSNGVSFKKENVKDKDNNIIYYINCYTNTIIKFRLKYNDETIRNKEFNNLIDDVCNGIINISLYYSGEVVE